MGSDLLGCSIQGAGTDAQVFIQLYGVDNIHSSSALHLHNGSTRENSFRKGSKSTFKVCSSTLCSS